MKHVLIILATILGYQFANADAYSCAKMIYKDGWLKKYDILGNTWGANTKKHGAVTSTIGSSIEKTTSSVDPGVSTGNFMSSMQYTSSWGECSMVNMQITQQMREDYIDQNMPELRKQIAMGQGLHVDNLAFVSGCKNIDRETWSRGLQQRTQEFYDAADAKSFTYHLDAMISADTGLKTNCSLLTI